MASSLETVKRELEWGLQVVEATHDPIVSIKPESAKIILAYINTIKESENGQNIIDA